ncbi:MAG: hypothetical protein D4S02_03905 [Rhodocyclaceae bacterium]|nr:MAG: hypothetical protein D4S02_03905 [Rhodocyclaceae bacterium]
MSKPLAPCSKCKGEMSMKILDTFHGDSGGVKLTIHEMPYVGCAEGHKRFVHVEFAGQLMDLMMDKGTYQSVPSAEKKGFFTHTYHCSGCKLELPRASTASKTLEVIAELNKAQPLKVLVEIPVFKCGGCGKECIQSTEETAMLAVKGIGHAYRSIDIHPT